MNELFIPAEMAELTAEIRQQMYNDYQIGRIIADGDNPCFSSQGGVLYNKDMTELLCYPRGKQSKIYHMPRTVSKIAPMAFSNGNGGATKLEEVFLSTSLKEIPDNCFRNMEIFGVKIPEGIENIGEYAFASTNLVCPTLPASLRHLAPTAFLGCSRMHLLNIIEDNFGLEKSRLPDNGEIHVIIETFEPVDHSKYPGISVMNLTEMEKWVMEI